MFLILPDILSADELADLAAGFDTAAFEDGRNTAAGAAQMVKKNRQISRQWPGIRHFENILDNALKRMLMPARFCLLQNIIPVTDMAAIPIPLWAANHRSGMTSQSLSFSMHRTLTPVENSGCIYRVGKFRMSNVKLAQPLPTQRP